MHMIARDGGFIVTHRDKTPVLTSALDAALALDNLLRLRSAMLPATAESNALTWARFRNLFRQYEWEAVVQAFEQTRLTCTAECIPDWSITCPEATNTLIVSRASKSAASNSPRAPTEGRLPKQEHRDLLNMCKERGICMKFQLSQCLEDEDHDNRKHVCSTCESPDHGSTRCNSSNQSKPKFVSSGKKRKAKEIEKKNA
jgi:hypothetical protein